MQNLSVTSKSAPTGAQAILQAAETLFSEKGFDAVSISAIAKLASTSKPNIYHHFKSKNDLYLAVLRAAARRLSKLLDAVAHAPGTSRQRLADFSALELDSILAHKRSAQLILREALSGGSQRGQDIAEHYVGQSFARLVAMVHEGQQSGEFREDIDPALAAFTIVAANLLFFQAAPVMQYLPEFRFTDDTATYNRGVMDIVFNGLLRHGENS